MTIKQLILSLLTSVVIFLVGFSLLDSWTKPQIQSQLELYQTDLLLQAAEWQSPKGENLGSARSALIGADPVENSLEQYQKVRQSAQTTLEQLSQTPSRLAPVPSEPELNPELGSPPVRPSPQQKLRQLIDQLGLRLGILHTQLGQTDAALKTWTDLTQQPSAQIGSKQLVETAKVLIGLWSDPPRLLPDAEQQIQQNLTGWFRDQALTQLYQLQQRQDALAELQVRQQAMAESALLRLTIVGGLPVLGSLIGVGLIIAWVARQVIGRKRPQLQASEEEASWPVPWGGETIWQVMVLWFTAFFGISLILVPLTVQLLGLNLTNLGARSQAFLALFNYGTMVVGGLSILYLCLRSFLPLPNYWFRFNWRGKWFKWGLGGYLAALPLVIVVSLLNQQLLQSHGGGNPLLDIILQGQDRTTIAVLFLMVAVLAPFFEETLFRGFFLPSLTRYFPTWSAIALSALVFAIAHLSLSDILPLTVLGMVLGYVYLRSRNLLTSILLHSLWNSGSFLALLTLGSGSG
jgi:membrane protease YdiL (CAAX protease family)